MALTFWLASILAGAFLAERKGRSVPGWILLGIFLGPIAFIILLVLPARQDELELRAIKQKKMKKCDECAELVRAEARKCRYCGHFFKVEQNKVEEKALPPAKGNTTGVEEKDSSQRSLVPLAILIGILLVFVIGGILSREDQAVVEIPSAARYTPSGTMIVEKCVEHFDSLSSPNGSFCDPYFQRWSAMYITHGRRTARNQEVNGAERATTENAARWGSLLLIKRIIDGEGLDSNLAPVSRQEESR